MTDEAFIIILLVLIILIWYFAIRKTIYHYKILKESNYGLLTKFFVLGIPYLFIIPKNSLNKDNQHLYKKGMKQLVFLIITNIIFFITLMLFK